MTSAREGREGEALVKRICPKGTNFQDYCSGLKTAWGRRLRVEERKIGMSTDACVAAPKTARHFPPLRAVLIEQLGRM